MNNRTRRDPPLWALMAELYRHLSPRRRLHLYLVLVLMILGAAAELATLGSLLPFLSLVAGVDQPSHTPSFSRFFHMLGATGAREQVWVAAILFATVAVLAGVIRLALNWSTQQFTAMLGHELSVEVQRRMLGQSYAFHLGHNSSEAVAAMDQVHSLVLHVLLQLMYAGVAGFTATVIIGALIYVDPFTATIAAVSFSLLYLLVSAITRPRLARNSEAIRTSFEERVRIVQESIGGVRDVIIDASQPVYLDAFSKVSRRYSLAAATNAFIATAPRFIIEAVGMAMIAIVSLLIIVREGSLAGAIPLLGAIALGSQRLLPLLQQVYHGWASVSGHRSAVSEVLKLLRLKPSEEIADVAAIEPLPLRESIALKNVNFAYPKREVPVLHDVTLEIPKGSIVGICGRTGSGKSTLGDLIMALIEPTKGFVAVDGAKLEGPARLRWRREIAHVPQSIFLADATIEQNIAFGVAPDRIDRERVRAAATSAQMDEFVRSLPEGFRTRIGERGIRLSGGQRQRLGIARALYKQAPILVLDEATSALDDATEAAVIKALSGLTDQGRTIIIIAHRPSTLARCDLLIRLEHGKASLARVNENEVVS